VSAVWRFCFWLALLFTDGRVYAAGIDALKDLHLETVLVEGGSAKAAIITSSSGRYDASVQRVRDRVRRLTGVELPLYRDNAIPNDILKTRDVIALGNMATNALIDTLYRQYYVILDLTYPGAGGSVVRSLHNPYGTGHNVIFLGGSDDAGVADAAEAFSSELNARGRLAVGWLMKIRLGKGLNPPDISPANPKWQVFSWRDSWRPTTSGAYKPSTFFGWNPVSIAGMLYYMTGKPDYLQTFKELALPSPGRIPAVNRADGAFLDPGNPLVKVDHYRAHLVDVVYDLIEESPLLTAEERLRITNKLLEHQHAYDPDNTYSVLNGDRHALWHMLSIYTGSRYFARSYPNPVWERRLDNVRRGFESFIGNPTWATADTLEWVATSLEPIFEFFTLDGSERFVRSGTARTFMSGVEILMNGEKSDYGSNALPISLLHKAAYLLDDGRYIWMLRQLGFDFSVFRIGQSYWPPESLKVAPPLDLVGRIEVYPLAEKDWKTAATAVPRDEAFQVLAYRSGLRETDDYLLFDGFYGQGRHAYQLNTLLMLRMFGGRKILSGYGNDVSVTVDGEMAGYIPRVAALKEKLAASGMAYIHGGVPDMGASTWNRHVLYHEDRGVIVIDAITAERPGLFDITLSWQTGSPIKEQKEQASGLKQLVTANGAALVNAEAALERATDTLAQTTVSRKLQQGEEVSLATLFHETGRPETVEARAGGGYWIGGKSPALVGTSRLSAQGLTAQADFAYVDRETIVLGKATELSVQGVQFLKSPVPVGVIWSLRDGRIRLASDRPTTVELSGSKKASVSIPAGESEHTVGSLAQNAARKLDGLLAGRDPLRPKFATAEKESPAPSPAWKARWQAVVPGAVRHLASSYGKPGEAWVVSQAGDGSHLTRLSEDGERLVEIKNPREVLSVLTPKSAEQARHFAIVLGFKDDTVRAYADNGRELWSFKAEVDPSFRIGDHYDAPWFTNPRPPDNKTGAYSLLVADFRGQPADELIVGRPSTVEFRDLQGKLLKRVPVKWGDVTSLAVLPSGYQNSGALVLAGKNKAGKATPSGIDSAHRLKSDDLFSEIQTGYTGMHAWMQNGIGDIVVGDLDSDGRDEVAYTITGAFNELRVYRGQTGKPLWMKYFGPDKQERSSMHLLPMTDIDGNGRNDIVVGSPTGRVIAYDHTGRTLWQQGVGSRINAIAVSGTRQRVAVGCADGSVYLYSGTGALLKSDNLGAPVNSVIAEENRVTAGSEKGIVRSYEM